MKLSSGITTAYHKDGSPYYRASITYHRKHISLGSYLNPETGTLAYQEAYALLHDSRCPLPEDYLADSKLPFEKYISLINLRANGIYIKTPIYLYPNYFVYYLSAHDFLKFDRDDLFFYASHSIQQRGGYLFVCHYGSQYGILSRYGIRAFAVEGRDYIFVNGDNHDYRYQNIQVLNHYMGVTQELKSGKPSYVATIHINGNYIIGRYATEETAAIAYNKAADFLTEHGLNKQFIRNYISSLSPTEYEALYRTIPISSKLDTVINSLPDS